MQRINLKRSQSGILHHLGLFMLVAVVVAVAAFAGVKTYNSVKHDKKSGAAGYTYYDQLGFPVSFRLGANAGLCKLVTTVNGVQQTTVYHRANLVAPNPYSVTDTYISSLEVKDKNGTSKGVSSLLMHLNDEKSGSVTFDPATQDLYFNQYSTETQGRGSLGLLDKTKLGNCEGSSAPLAIGMKITPLRSIPVGTDLQITWTTSGKAPVCTAQDGWSGSLDPDGLKTVKSEVFSGYTIKCTSGTTTAQRTFYPNMPGTVVTDAPNMPTITPNVAVQADAPALAVCKQSIVKSGKTYYNVVVKATRKSAIVTDVGLSYLPAPGTYINATRVSTWTNNVTYGAILASKLTDKVQFSYVMGAAGGPTMGEYPVSYFYECDPLLSDNALLLSGFLNIPYNSKCLFEIRNKTATKPLSQIASANTLVGISPQNGSGGVLCDQPSSGKPTYGFYISDKSKIYAYQTGKTGQPVKILDRNGGFLTNVTGSDSGRINGGLNMAYSEQGYVDGQSKIVKFASNGNNMGSIDVACPSTNIDCTTAYGNYFYYVRTDKDTGTIVYVPQWYAGGDQQGRAFVKQTQANLTAKQIIKDVCPTGYKIWAFDLLSSSKAAVVCFDSSFNNSLYVVDFTSGAAVRTAITLPSGIAYISNYIVASNDKKGFYFKALQNGKQFIFYKSVAELATPPASIMNLDSYQEVKLANYNVTDVR